MMSRFAKSLLAIIASMLLLAMLALMHPPSRVYIDPWTGQLFGEGGVEKTFRSQTPAPKHLTSSGMNGTVIMGKLGNETAKAALGRATWKLLHTITLRFPEIPSQDERDALESYIYLSARLYPCGECATEFQQLLKKFPPQTSSRRAASLWLCHIHNQVNARLQKPNFDCARLDAEYDCGCGDAPLKRPAGVEHNLSSDDVTGAALINGG